MKSVSSATSYLIISAGLFIAGCAATAPPSELVFARVACLHVQTGRAQQLVPDAVLIAERALAVAEQSFKDEPSSFITRDLAYYAGQKAHHAEVLALAAHGVAGSASRETALADVTPMAQSPGLEEASGIVATLPVSVMFAPDQSDLLPAACVRLNQVVAALMVTKERRLTIEVHSDSNGSTVFSRVLSQQRANVVRAYIISRGYSGTLIIASGLGGSRPVASNASPKDRSNNRRVDIIIDAPPSR